MILGSSPHPSLIHLQFPTNSSLSINHIFQLHVLYMVGGTLQLFTDPCVDHAAPLNLHGCFVSLSHSIPVKSTKKEKDVKKNQVLHLKSSYVPVLVLAIPVS
ncbi:hypothetical protein O6H91_11G096200 [Diphasiastrum complanatum]|uniref:Uncharacterized protein n=1 Tax=Diphasiastrum complanatum TaxID=34168 RepID=A0ACC2CCT7_DIPCM|nr:hypothetical protein O6H91_11G096200 [Diphasiastrum complanatum]